MLKTHLRSFLLALVVLGTSCHHRTKTLGFYYWRTTFAPDSLERQTLKNNGVQTLYIRYFDVDWPPEDTMPRPVAPARFEATPIGLRVIPVIFLRNRVFEKITPTAIPQLVDQIHGLVRRISTSAQAQPQAIQFDCDWTQRTKDNYFSFLRTYKTLSNDTISATIRLHQVKYPGQAGIPPVDHGALMVYNMGNIDAGNGSSIYDPSIAHRYIPSLRTYPLTLEIALPVFSWSLLVREGRVVQLLDKMNSTSFEKDTNFVRTGPKGFAARHANFRGGYYFRENDIIKIESVSPDDLHRIVSDLNECSNHRILNLIFFDLDSQNIVQYDKHLFKEILDHTD